MTRVFQAQLVLKALKAFLGWLVQLVQKVMLVLKGFRDFPA